MFCRISQRPPAELGQRTRLTSSSCVPERALALVLPMGERCAGQLVVCLQIAVKE